MWGYEVGAFHAGYHLLLNYMHIYMYMVQIQILFNYVSHIHILAAGTLQLHCVSGGFSAPAGTYKHQIRNAGVYTTSTHVLESQISGR